MLRISMSFYTCVRDLVMFNQFYISIRVSSLYEILSITTQNNRNQYYYKEGGGAGAEYRHNACSRSEGNLTWYSEDQ